MGLVILYVIAIVLGFVGYYMFKSYPSPAKFFCFCSLVLMVICVIGIIIRREYGSLIFAGITILVDLSVLAEKNR